MYPKRLLRPLLCIAGLLACTALMALPDDTKQPIYIDASSGDLLADGWSVLKGTAEKPVKITQGSLQIAGTEMRVFRQHGEAITAIVTGDPARFQQQQAQGQEPAKASAREIRFDNKAQLLILDTMVEYSQNGTVIAGNHLEYNLASGAASASSKDGQQVHMTIPPSKGKQ